MKIIGKMKTYPSNKIKKSFVGIGFECLDRDMFKAQKCYDILGKSGIKYARCQTGWAKCEKKKGIYDFSWLDEIVDNLIKRGIIPWFNVGFGNPIYMDNISNETAVGCVPILYGEEAMKAWENYTAALAKHFSGRVEYYEIWNEPDCSQFWYPGESSAQQYAEMVKKTGLSIRSAYKNAKIGACISRFNFEYAQQLISRLNRYDIDFFAYHAYSLSPENNYRESIHHLKRLLDRYGLENVSLWQGESGFPSWFPNNHWLCPKAQSSERQQAVWQLRRYFTEAYEGVQLSSFFQIADMWEKEYVKARETLNKPAAHGILNGLVYTPKKSYETLSRTAALFSGDVKRADFMVTSGYKGDRSRLYAKECMAYFINGKPFVAYYVPENVEDEVKLKSGFWLNVERIKGKIEFDNPVVIDMLSGDVYSVDIKDKTYNTYYFEDLPYCDYPMMLCDKSSAELEEM